MNELQLPFETEWCDELTSLTLSDGRRQNTEAHLKFEFHFDWEEWARPWSISAFADTIESVVREYSISGLTTFREDEDFVANGFGFECRIEQLGETVKGEIERWVPKIEVVVLETIQRLMGRSVGHSLSQTFRFPSEVSVACEQYLIYFGQFLADLGIEATVDLSHVADQSLFRVTPKDSKQALEAIRSALDDYLEMPSANVVESALSGSSEVALLQLRANVSHLQSQLTLAQAIIEAKNSSIQALHLSNFRLQELSRLKLAGAVATPNLEIISESESLIDGVLSMKKTEVKGVVIHWPEIIRKLKRRIRR